ncbi:MAG TPA: hypothetical protein PL185_13155 [Flavobacteriales bacterium]|nr:hypothetical protein [Flavobacteriales bacterium]HPH83518.1 hypothetical protein [Flavobacteriales bacterium]
MNSQVGKKQAGIWLDHVEALLIDPYASLTNIERIQSDYESQVREPGESGDGRKLGANRSSNNEYSKHSIEQHDLHAFFKKVADSADHYNELYIFGPGTAPKEFAHFLEQDKRFKNVLITTARADYLNESKLQEEVKDFFQQSLSTSK